MNILKKNYIVSLVLIAVLVGTIIVYHCIAVKGDITENSICKIEFKYDEEEKYSDEFARSDKVLGNIQEYKFNKFQVIKFN
jgi:hypothetical protein